MQFFKTEVSFLGNIILKEGNAICPDKCEAILNWPVPTTCTKLKKFMGTVNFLWKFCVGISGVAAPLSRLGSEKVPFTWTLECNFAFCQIRKLFTEAPLLRHADLEKQFIMETDASDCAYAGVLLQEFEGVEHPVSYYSGKFNGAQVNYPVHDKKLYAVIGCLTHWRHHTQGTKLPVIIRLDNKSLSFFWTKQKYSTRQTRWAEFITRFNSPLRSSKVLPICYLTPYLGDLVYVSPLHLKKLNFLIHLLVCLLITSPM